MAQRQTGLDVLHRGLSELTRSGLLARMCYVSETGEWALLYKDPAAEAQLATDGPQQGQGGRQDALSFKTPGDPAAAAHLAAQRVQQGLPAWPGGVPGTVTDGCVLTTFRLPPQRPEEQALLMERLLEQTLADAGADHCLLRLGGRVLRCQRQGDTPGAQSSGSMR